MSLGKNFCLHLRLLPPHRTTVALLFSQQQQQQQPFNNPLSRTTQISLYQKGKTSLDLLEQQTVSGSGISLTMCKSAPCPRQITTPASQHSVFYRPDAVPATQPTVSQHWRHCYRPTKY